MRGTPVGRFRRFRPEMPAAIAPEVTIRYSFFDQSNWSTIPRSRLISICPPGAMRLVPTLITTRMFAGSCDFALPRIPMGRMQPGRDNTSILPLEWAFWQVEFTPMPASNATSRFSDRVENYVRYRPGYPG